MKRWFSLALVALFLVPVLVVPAAASEVYEFECLEPIALYEDSFQFEAYENMYFCAEFLPDGYYTFSGVDLSCEPFEVNFEWSDTENAFIAIVNVTFVFPDLEPQIVQIFLGKSENFGGTLLVCNFREGDSLTLVRTGPLPSQGGFTSMFEDFSVFTGSCVNFVSEVAKTITGSPLLLLTCGFLSLGGCIGITGRLLSRG